jgi:hypothetical protein
MKKILFTTSLAVLFLSGCASSPARTPSGERIARGVNTIVIASKKSAKDFVRQLKYRALEKDFAFESTDEDTRSFVTKVKPLSKKVGISLKAYVRDVDGGSNAIVSGSFTEFKAKGQKVSRIENRSSGVQRATWDILYDYAVADPSARYNFLERP